MFNCNKQKNKSRKGRILHIYKEQLTHHNRETDDRQMNGWRKGEKEGGMEEGRKEKG